MDDILTSLETDDEAVKARVQLIQLLGKAGLKIRPWRSKKPKVLEGVPLEDRVENVNFEESELPCVKALGVLCNDETDMFTFKLNPPQDIVYTKRQTLHNQDNTKSIRQKIFVPVPGENILEAVERRVPGDTQHSEEMEEGQR